MSRSRSRPAPSSAPSAEAGGRARPRRRPKSAVTSAATGAPKAAAEGAGESGADRHFRLLADCATEYTVFMLDTEGRIADWNSAAQRLHGYAAAEVVGRPVGVLFAPDDAAREAPGRALEEARRAGCSVRAATCLRKDGHRFAVRAELRAIRDAAGACLGFGHLMRDMSDQGAPESPRDGRPAPAARGQAEMQKAASDFMAVISHEIRTPLTSIKGFVDILAAENLSPLQRRYVDLTRSSCAALMSVVDDVLDFTRIESGAIDLDPEPLSLAVLAHNALSTVLGTAGPKGLSLAVKIAPDVPPSLIGDRGRLRQILLNLLTNAVKFTLRGSVTLEVTHEGRAGSGERIRFAVTDTGIGIPENRLDRLFNRFSQADADIRSRFGGSGLGLAICKQLVERMGGEIGVETALGRGSTFWFRLTLPRAHGVPAAPAEGPQFLTVRKDVRLLLVEDGSLNQEIARVFLEHAGYDVRIVDNGRDAIDAVQASRFDSVLMDMQMPEMDGLEATRRIRALGGDYARLPIIALSARVFPEDIEQCRAAGMNDHIAKPFDREQMYQVIERWTARA